MTTPRYAYPEFEANQVLSFQHLNQLTDFLEGQDRLTRRALIGAGVVRGLDISWRDGVGLVLSPGVALTSDGHLAVFESETICNARRVYAPPGGYTYFPDGTTLWEMLPADTAAEPPGEPLTSALVEGQTALLFLEMTSADLDRCIGDNCINQGREHRLVWRVLLVPNATAITIRLRSLGLPTTGPVLQVVGPATVATPLLTAVGGVSPLTPINVFNPFSPTTRLLDALYPAWRLPVPAWEKFLLTPGVVISHEAMVQQAEAIFRNIPANLGSMIARAISLLARGLGDDAAISDAVTAFRTNFDAALTALRSRQSVGWQHLWDHLRHLYAAYAELREAAFAWQSSLPPPAEDFPLHVFLGTIPPADTLVARIYRTRFIPSPALTLGGQDQDLCRQRLDRLLVLARSFAWSDPSPLRITPGARWNSVLEQRAAPFFYAPDAVLPAWSLTARQRFRVGNQFNYHRENLSGDAPTQDPLRFEFDGADFFRIEGHQGRTRSEVEKFLADQRQNYDLPFQVSIVRYGAAGSDSTLSPSDLEDIDALYKVSSAEMKCHLNRLLSLLSNLSKPKSPLTDVVLVDGGRLNIDYTKFVLFQPQAATAATPVATPQAAGIAATAAGTTIPLMTPLAAGLATTTVPTNRALSTNIERLSPTTARIELTAAASATAAGTAAVNSLATATVAQIPGRIFDFAYIPLPDLILPQIDPVTRVNLLVQELLGRLTQAGEQLTDEIAEFQPEELQTNLADARNRARSLQLSLTDLMKSEGYKIQGFENDLLEELAAFQGNCVPTRLVQIMAEWTARFERIKAIPTLGTFITKHPGLEHRSGVCAGGTLVLVVGRPATTIPPRQIPPDLTGVVPRVPISITPGLLAAATTLASGNGTRASSAQALTSTVARISTPSSILLSSLLPTTPSESSPATAQLATLIQNNLNRADTVNEISLSSQLASLLNDLIQRPVATVEDIVLADFYLPYVCCTERRQISYLVIPDLQLSLPQSSFRKDDDQRYPFTALPPGGKLEGPGLATAADGSFLFVPNAADVAVGAVRFTYSVIGRSVNLTVQIEPAPVPPPPPVPLSSDFSFTIVDRAARGAFVQFNHAALGNPEKFEWDFGNGVRSTVETPDPVFYAPGRFIVVLTVTRGTETADAKKVVTIEAVPLAAAFTFVVGDRTPRGTPVNFTNTSTGSPEQFDWDFGNGQRASDRDPKPVIYLEPGSYQVVLTVLGGSEKARTAQKIAIPFERPPQPQPVPTPIVITPRPVVIPTPVIPSVVTPTPVVTPRPPIDIITPVVVPTPVVTPVVTPAPVVITPAPIVTPTPVITPAPVVPPTNVVTPVITPAPIVTPQPPIGVVTPVVRPTPVITPVVTPTPIVITPRPIVTPAPVITPTPIVITPRPVGTPTPAIGRPLTTPTLIDTTRIDALRKNPLFATAVGGENTALARTLNATADLIVPGTRSKAALATLTAPANEKNLDKSLDATLTSIVKRLTEPPARMTAEEAQHLFLFGTELAATTLAAFEARADDLATVSPLVSTLLDFAKALPALRRRALTRKLAAEDATIASLKSSAGNTAKPVLAKTAQSLADAFAQ